MSDVQPAMNTKCASAAACGAAETGALITCVSFGAPREALDVIWAHRAYLDIGLRPASEAALRAKMNASSA